MSYQNEYTQEDKKIKLLKNLHDNKWGDDLLGADFEYVFNNVLTPTERIVTEELVSGKPLEDIMTLLGVSEATITRHVYSIKKKYRNQTATRVDHYSEVKIMGSARKEIEKVLVKVSEGLSPETGMKKIHPLLDTIFNAGVGFKRRNKGKKR